MIIGEYMREIKNIMVTGGAGFIGSNFIRYIFDHTNYKGNVINYDLLTYAANLESLDDITSRFGGKRYFFERGNICDINKVETIILKYNIDTIVHFAAESHVDRSILYPETFIDTNIIGTFRLLEAVKKLWIDNNDVLFHHVSTDEVYGSLDKEGFFYESTPYNPCSPYSASKASSDHLVRSYNHTYKIPVTISNCSNNYGPYQFPEKLIPLMINNILKEIPLPVYGDGKNIRDWLYVEDHNSAIWMIINNGISGETFNIGGENEWENIKLVNILCEKIALFFGKEKDYYKKLITLIKDRPGHDKRYAINCDKIKKHLGWKQKYTFETGLDMTIKWYIENLKWIDHVRTGEYKKWIDLNYGKR